MSHRCHVCDRVDDRRLVTYDEQYYKGPYHRDLRYSKSDICQECLDVVTEALYTEEIESDPITPFPNY